jgi:TolB-like protein
VAEGGDWLDRDLICLGYGLLGPVAPVADEAAWPAFSIAVLPFIVIGANPDDHYLADGITDDLLTCLSHIQGTRVIGRSSMFTYRGRLLDPREVGRDLNVRYVVAGTVRRGSTGNLVNVELVDTATGLQDWAEKIEYEASDWQTVSDVVSRRIARALNLELMDFGSRSVAARTHRAAPQAGELAMRGWVELFNKPQTRETNDSAQRWLKKALALDRDLALAWTGLAYATYRAASFGWAGYSLTDGLCEAVEFAERAIELEPRTADAYYAKGQALNGLGKVEEAQAAHKMCIALNASHAPAYGALGQVRLFLGYPEETAPLCAHALMLSPREPLRAIWLRSRGLAALFLGDAEAAAADARAAIAINSKYPTAYVLLAAAEYRLGRRSTVAEILAKLPDASEYRTVADVRRTHARPGYERYSAFLEEMLTDLRRAGLPE